MATHGTPIIQHLRRMVLRVDGAGMTDGQLLEEFVSHRDAAAFESLVRRHGPMVLGVCRRILRDPHDAEDAFQSTFMVLARKAASVSPRELVGNWLYGVAQTTAIRLRAANAKRRLRERQVADMPEPEAMPKDHQDDLRQLLDEELARLPDKFRVPIVLCDLEDRTRREVARQLKLPEGTLSSRLTTARRMLAKRLARHGLAVSGGMWAAALSQSAASACMSVSLVSSTVKAATLAAAGQTATGLISAPVAALTEGVLKAMFLTKVKTVMGVTLMVASLCGAAGLIYQTHAAEQQKATEPTEKAGQKKLPVVGKKESPKPDKQPALEDDSQAIRGTWRVISVQHRSEKDAGEDAKMWEKSQWIIDAYNVVIGRGDWSEGGGIVYTYKLDSSKKLKKLDLQILGHTIPALYALEGDVLQIRLGFHARTRPKGLTAEDNGNTVLLILKRESVLKPKARRAPEKTDKENRPEPKKTEETEPSKSGESMGYIKTKLGPQEYQALFGKMLAVMAGHFEQIIYADQYEGKTEAYKIMPLTTNQLSIQRRAFVRFEARDYGYLITVRINKIRISGTESVVLGRDTELEQLILKKLNARQLQEILP